MAFVGDMMLLPVIVLPIRELAVVSLLPGCRSLCGG